MTGNDGEGGGMTGKEAGMTGKEAGMADLAGMTGLRRRALPPRANGLPRAAIPRFLGDRLCKRGPSCPPATSVIPAKAGIQEP